MKRLLFYILASTLLISGVATAQDENRILRAAIDQEPTSLNPYYTIQAAAYNFIDLYLLEPWLMNENIELQPILVDELPINVAGGVTLNDEGNTVVRYTLNDAAMWSDGTPVTAADFIFPFEVANDGLSNTVVAFTNIANVEVGESAKEVVVTFNTPSANWFDAGWYPLPEHILREEYEAALAEGAGLDTLAWNFAPTVSNGPFLFEEFVSGSFMRFVRNDAFSTPAWFEEIVVNFYPDPTVMRAILENGEADIAHNFQPADVIDLQDNPNLIVDSKFDSGREAWWFNLGRDPNPVLQDRRVRQAIAMGLDRQLIVDELLGGLTDVPNSFWDNTPFYNDEIPVIEYDPEGARALLAEVGYSDSDGDGICEANGVEGVADGTPLSFSVGTTTTPLRIDTQVVAQDLLAEICIDVELSNYESSQWATPFTEGGGFRGGFDGALQFFGFTAFEGIQPPPWFNCNQIPSEDNPNGINVTHTCFEEMDAQWQALGTTLDADEAQAIADEIQQFMAEEVFWIGLWNRPQLTIYGADLVNVRPGGQTPYINVAEWERIS